LLGFVIRIASSAPRLHVRSISNAKTNRITLTIANHGSHGVVVDVLDKYTGKTTSHSVDAGTSFTKRCTLAPSEGWYDFVVTPALGSTFAAEIAGHLETGDDSITDPAMGGVL
jgi:phospholipase C